MIFSGISVRMPVCKRCPSCDCEVYVRKLDCPSCGLVLRKLKAKPLVEDLAKRRTLERVYINECSLSAQVNKLILTNQN